MSDPTSSAARPILPLMGFVSLVALGGMAAYNQFQHDRALVSAVRQDLEAQVQDRIADFEDDLVSQLNGAMDQAIADGVDPARLQHELREEPWFDSLYLWVPRRAVAGDGRRARWTPARMLFPPPTPPDRFGEYAGQPCVMATRMIADVTPPALLAEAWVRGCAGAPLAVQAFAASEAFSTLFNAQDPAGALAVLQVPGIDDERPINGDLDRGISTFRRALRRIQIAHAEMALGRESAGLDRMARTAAEITQLDGPALEPVLSFVQYPIINELRAHGRKDQAQRIERLFRRSERRQRALEELDQRVLEQTSPSSTAPRFVYDQYSPSPYVLYYGQFRDGDRGVALQLDQPGMIDSFIDETKRLRKHLVVLDATGRRLAGDADAKLSGIEAPFSRTLTHLRVALTEEGVAERVDRVPSQSIFLYLAMLASITGGGVALAAQFRAAEHHRLLHQRQRDFTTRVTHELKTPLAGIRIMAENLAAGAWATEAQREDMAQRIIDEADRLTQRVDEVLAVARTREIPHPKVFDPEEPLMETVEQWGPRMEAAGIQFEADFDVTDGVLGDAVAIRDAVSCLLDNALKYADPSKTEHLVRLSLRQDGRFIHVRVEDNGLGVPPGMRESIFERFVRVEGPNRGTAGGHGLGLAQVREIARAHKGTVQCEDGEIGTCFHLRLPTVEA